MQPRRGGGGLRWKRLQCCVPVFNDMLFCREALQRLSPVVRSRREQRVKNVKRPCFRRAAVATLIVDRSRCGGRLKWRQFAGFLYSCRLSAWGNRPRFRRIHYSLDARQRKDKETKCFAVLRACSPVARIELSLGVNFVGDEILFSRMRGT